MIDSSLQTAEIKKPADSTASEASNSKEIRSPAKKMEFRPFKLEADLAAIRANTLITLDLSTTRVIIASKPRLLQHSDVAPLLAALLDNRSVVEINLQNVVLNDTVIPLLISLITRQPAILFSLDLRNTGISPSGFEGLYQAAKARIPMLNLKHETLFAKESCRLLQHVACAEYDEAQALVLKNPELLLCKGDITDLSKRTFTGITAFQYAIWALDWHMWTIFLKYLAPAEAFLQWKELETLDTPYGKEVSWKALADNHMLFHQRGYPPLMWCNEIGGGQLLLPAHVVSELFSEPMPVYPYPVPDFTTPVQGKRTDIKFFYDSNLGISVAWYRRGSLIGRAVLEKGVPETSKASGPTIGHVVDGAGVHDGHFLAALYATRCRQKEELVETLLSYCIKNLVEACRTGNEDDIKDCLKLGNAIKAKDTNGQTALHHAIFGNNNIQAVQRLIKHGANLEAKDKVNGYAPLHLAALYGLFDVIKCLLESGADVDARSNHGMTPLHLAANFNGNKEIVKLLLLFGADPDAKANNGILPGQGNAAISRDFIIETHKAKIQYHTFYASGKACHATGALDKAIEYYNQAIQWWSSDASIFYVRGTAWQAKEQLDKALDDYTQAIQLQSHYIDAFYARGLIWQIKNEVDKALKDFETVLRLDPEHVEAKQYRNQLAEKQKPKPGEQPASENPPNLSYKLKKELKAGHYTAVTTAKDLRIAYSSSTISSTTALRALKDQLRSNTLIKNIKIEANKLIIEPANITDIEQLHQALQSANILTPIEQQSNFTFRR